MTESDLSMATMLTLILQWELHRISTGERRCKASVARLHTSRVLRTYGRWHIAARCLQELHDPGLSLPGIFTPPDH
jgi:hypothetical protein